MNEMLDASTYYGKRLGWRDSSSLDVILPKIIQPQMYHNMVSDTDVGGSVEDLMTTPAVNQSFLIG
jgi:hypothetical protein